MVCPICRESYFKALHRGASTRGSPGSTAGTEKRPVVLGCGHAFHKNCIEDWFESSSMQRCPQCKVFHKGSPTVLYIDVDEEDYKAGRSTKIQQPNMRSAYNRRDSADVRQLAWDISSMHFDGEARDYHVMCELTRRNQELEDSNGYLEEGLEEALRALHDEMEARGNEFDELEDELEGQRRLQRRTNTLLQESNDCLRREKEHTTRLESRLEAVNAQATCLRDNNFSLRRALEAKNKELRKYQEQYGYMF
ncbi:hypothetical protein IW146_000413 [Coemansia sp. RSA 922]|nr:hypothetical protein GGH13_002720 [Coemansia sp. S155-1]KAJ2117835.1 hypothetical protein IW146_000413 [Coemansia sp. RSA 922]